MLKFFGRSTGVPTGSTWPTVEPNTRKLPDKERTMLAPKPERLVFDESLPELGGMTSRQLPEAVRTTREDGSSVSESPPKESRRRSELRSESCASRREESRPKFSLTSSIPVRLARRRVACPEAVAAELRGDEPERRLAMSNGGSSNASDEHTLLPPTGS